VRNGCHRARGSIFFGNAVKPANIAFDFAEVGENLMNIKRHQAGPRMSQAVEYGNTVYLAGQVAADAKTGVVGQTEQILQQIDKLLAAAASDKSKLLSATIYLADIATFAEMNSVWDRWVDKQNPPARATVEAKLAAPQYKVEIMVVAAK
jgi:enamine deaminase RidA (YjgF/YER057c/UK114 family)